ncbi:hypothetical protein [Streptomyces sp. NBC_01465]|nr:hypothetical protein [Streptomyces sp. NBC_01465]
MATRLRAIPQESAVLAPDNRTVTAVIELGGCQTGSLTARETGTTVSLA